MRALAAALVLLTAAPAAAQGWTLERCSAAVLKADADLKACEGRVVACDAQRARVVAAWEQRARDQRAAHAAERAAWHKREDALVDEVAAERAARLAAAPWWERQWFAAALGGAGGVGATLLVLWATGRAQGGQR